jgi:hypothetical protein
MCVWRLTVGLLATAALVVGAAADAPLPHQLALPPQFHANISIVAHLVDRVRGRGGRSPRITAPCAGCRRATCSRAAPCAHPAPTPHPVRSPSPLSTAQTKPYPPWRRRIEVWYDLPARKARAYVHEGFEANKTFLRRYDTKQEYLIRDDEFAECRRAYLSECEQQWTGGGAARHSRWGSRRSPVCRRSSPSPTVHPLASPAGEPMEAARFPADLNRRPGTHAIAGRPSTMYLRKDAYTRVRVYVDVETGREWRARARSRVAHWGMVLMS